MREYTIKRRLGYVVASIGEFALMDVPATEPNDCGVFTKCIMVDIPLPKGYGAFVDVARSKQGKWYISTEFCTRTGYSGGLPWLDRDAYNSREEAFIAGVRRLERKQGAERFGSYFAMAKQEFFKCHHRQLGLF